jgi:F0F1-type ATP synthase membrane subunit b/b'
MKTALKPLLNFLIKKNNRVKYMLAEAKAGYQLFNFANCLLPIAN